MLYKGFEIFEDDLGRICIYNTESKFSRDSDHIVINGKIKDAKSEINNRIEIKKASSAFAKLGGSCKSDAKTKSSRENGKLGGRPKKPTPPSGC